jgi:hypothetical protein
VREVYVTDAALTEEINQSIAELYDKLVAASPDYFESSQSVDIVDGTASYALPADYYKTLGVDVLRSDNTYIALKKYNLAERNFYDNAGGVQREFTVYRIRGSNIVLVPTPNWSETSGLRHLYIPAPSRLSNDSDTFDGIAGWEDWVVYDVCIKIIGGKEEGDASQFERLLAKLDARITQMARSRDVGEPDSIRDVDAEDAERVWPKYAP